MAVAILPDKEKYTLYMFSAMIATYSPYEITKKAF